MYVICSIKAPKLPCHESMQSAHPAGSHKESPSFGVIGIYLAKTFGK
jgi:hypothetical protein